MTRLLQLSARCHGDGAPYKAAAGVGLARRARTAPSQSLAGARRPRHGGRGLSPVLARAVSRPWRGGRRGAGRGRLCRRHCQAGDGPTLAPGARPRLCPHPAPEVSAPEGRGPRRAHTTPLKGSARGFGWNRGLRLSQLGDATKSVVRAPPGTPSASLCPQYQRKKSSPVSLQRGSG